jgi:hypothetical protein
MYVQVTVEQECSTNDMFYPRNWKNQTTQEPKQVCIYEVLKYNQMCCTTLIQTAQNMEIRVRFEAPHTPSSGTELPQHLIV